MASTQHAHCCTAGTRAGAPASRLLSCTFPMVPAPSASPRPPRSMLPMYARHVERNPETLLTRFYGVHRVKPSHGRKVGRHPGGHCTLALP